MAMRVVLYHSSQGHQMGGAACFSLGPPTTTDVMDQHGAELVSRK